MQRMCGFASIEDVNVCPGSGPGSICAAQNQYTSQHRRGCGKQRTDTTVLKNTATPVSTPIQQFLLTTQTRKGTTSNNLLMKTQK
jgi:hypothetical protein